MNNKNTKNLVIFGLASALGYLLMKHYPGTCIQIGKLAVDGARKLQLENKKSEDEFQEGVAICEHGVYYCDECLKKKEGENV